EVPRASYPEGRAGYHKWRTDLMRKHAALAGELLTAAGYGEEVVARTRSLIEKRALRSDPDAQALEDAACLVFLELDCAEFVAKHDDDDKILGILRKTWSKMSDAARSLATTVPLVGRGAELLARALEGE
ncbi:MAG: DUF4202 domain-containing protein, partial [Myxococcales bacterium]|nr:DUF4202 domain-containing protein [Myxococcales bacterium]